MTWREQLRSDPHTGWKPQIVNGKHPLSSIPNSGDADLISERGAPFPEALFRRQGTEMCRFCGGGGGLPVAEMLRLVEEVEFTPSEIVSWAVKVPTAE